jgi:hypothetical protein
MPERGAKMDIEFHYYITYIIARRAGFSADDAFLLSCACQLTDDNNDTYEISLDTQDYYKNAISQTMNILKPRTDLMRIYPIYHFMPGTEEEVNADSARRADGQTNPLNTIPDNGNAKRLLRTAFASKNIYRIGIASHMYADTFAHRNFTGAFEDFNFMGGVADIVVPDVGHAHARHRPDLPALIWNDERLIPEHAEVNNKIRFSQAAKRLFEEYCGYLEKTADATELVTDLSDAIGEHDEEYEQRQDQRIEQYKRLIGDEFREYIEDDWFKDAVDYLLEETEGNKQDTVPQQKAVYRWKEGYKDSHWFRFQEAVKAHESDALNLIGPLIGEVQA